MRITEGHLSRHYQGRSGGRDPALLDIAQDYALVVLNHAGVFNLGDDQLARGPIDPSDVLSERDETVFTAEQIGYLTKPVDIVGWEQKVRSRYGFLVSLDDDERQWAGANPADRWNALQAVKEIEQI